MKRIILMFSIWLVMIALPTFAKSDPALFHTQVVVKDRSQSAWEQGVRKALGAVLIKVSGDIKINELPKIQQLKPSLQALVQSFSYTRGVSSGQLTQLLLDVYFDPLEIRDLLKEQQVPMWAESRGTTMLWLTLPSDQGPAQVLAEDQYPNYVSILQAAAEKRGVNLLLPKMDVSDISHISVRDVLDKNIPLLNEASARYKANNILIANATFREDQYWHLNCVWVSSAGQIEWQLQDKSVDNLLAQTVNQLMDQMLSQHTTLRGKGSTQSSVIIRVVGVNGISAYTRVINYLKELAPIKGVNVETIESDAVVLSVTYGGSTATLLQSIQNANGNRLTKVDTESESDTNTSKSKVAYVYRWSENVATVSDEDKDL